MTFALATFIPATATAATASAGTSATTAFGDDTSFIVTFSRLSPVPFLQAQHQLPLRGLTPETLPPGSASAATAHRGGRRAISIGSSTVTRTPRSACLSVAAVPARPAVADSHRHRRGFNALALGQRPLPVLPDLFRLNDSVVVRPRLRRLFLAVPRPAAAAPSAATCRFVPAVPLVIATSRASFLPANVALHGHPLPRRTGRPMVPAA